MSSLDHIIDRVCEASGADFAFVLTRRGRIATRNAPQDMPEAGRLELVRIADAILARRAAMQHHELPRQALVPYGGAAPIDVYVAAREEAILCVVMATFTSQSRVGPAMAQGLIDLDALLESEGGKRSRRRGAKAKPANAKSSRGSRKSIAPPALDFDDVAMARGTVPFMAPMRAGRRPTPPPLPPDITVTEAALGRATLAAIQVDAEAPDITYGMAPIGRATVAEIELSMLPSGDPRSSIPEVRVELSSMPEIDVKELEVTDRQTLPFTEAAIDSKRAFDARGRGSEAAITISDSPQRTVIVGRSARGAPQRSQPMPPPPLSGAATKANIARGSEKAQSAAPAAASASAAQAAAAGERPKTSKPPGRNSNVELWHRALGEITDDEEEEPTVKTSRPPRPLVAAPKRKASIVPPAVRTSRPPKPKG